MTSVPPLSLSLFGLHGLNLLSGFRLQDSTCAELYLRETDGELSVDLSADQGAASVPSLDLLLAWHPHFLMQNQLVLTGERQKPLLVHLNGYAAQRYGLERVLKRSALQDPTLSLLAQELQGLYRAGIRYLNLDFAPVRVFGQLDCVQQAFVPKHQRQGDLWLRLQRHRAVGGLTGLSWRLYSAQEAQGDALRPRPLRMGDTAFARLLNFSLHHLTPYHTMNDPRFSDGEYEQLTRAMTDVLPDFKAAVLDHLPPTSSTSVLMVKVPRLTNSR